MKEDFTVKYVSASRGTSHIWDPGHACIQREISADETADAGESREMTVLALDDSLLTQAFGFIRRDPAQGLEQHVGVLAEQRRTADRNR
jgi:hypothetical protein